MLLQARGEVQPVDYNTALHAAALREALHAASEEAAPGTSPVLVAAISQFRVALEAVDRAQPAAGVSAALFAACDKLRDQLRELGVKLEDGKP
jgi:cysteinyl-tRNA synthetase